MESSQRVVRMPPDIPWHVGLGAMEVLYLAQHLDTPLLFAASCLVPPGLHWSLTVVPSYDIWRH